MQIERTMGLGILARTTGLRAGLGCALLLCAGGCSTIRDHRGYLVDSALV